MSNTTVKKTSVSKKSTNSKTKSVKTKTAKTSSANNEVKKITNLSVGMLKRMFLGAYN